jgi:hypothetical protein
MTGVAFVGALPCPDNVGAITDNAALEVSADEWTLVGLVVTA